MKRRPIPGWEGLYDVTIVGDVISLPRVIVQRNGVRYRVAGKTLKPQLLSNRYLSVTLYDAHGGRQEHNLVHRLVAIAFLPNPEQKPQVNHLNSNRLDNRVANLEWATEAESTMHMMQSGNWKKPPNRWALR